MTNGMQAVDPSVSHTPIPLDGKDLATICVLCSHNCGIRVDVEDGRVTDIRADETNPITRGYICNKVMSVPSYIRHGQRLEHPLRRRPDGTFERVDWDTAIREIGTRLAAIRARHSPRAIGLVGIGGQGNHMDAVFGLSFLKLVGSRRWFNAFAQEKTQHNLVDQWMMDAPPATFLHPDVEHTRYLLVFGTNPRISNRGHNATETFKALAADPKRTVVVVDPRVTETSRQAERHLRVRPGTDCHLLIGLAAVIVQRRLWDEKFVAERTTGFEALRAVLERVDVAEMARRAGLDAATVVEVATGFAGAESASILYDLGVEQTPFSTLNSYLFRVLLTLTGNLGTPGGNVFVETFVPPKLSGGRTKEPERALVSGIGAIRALGNIGMFSPSLVPEEVLADHPEHLRAIIVEGSNPLLSYADAARWREAIARLDLLVVVEPAFTETARLAHYVLPTPVGYEKWEIAAFPKRHPEIDVQLRPPVVPGPPEALPEPEIYARLVEAMGLVGHPPLAMRALARFAMLPGVRVLFAMAMLWAGARGQRKGRDGQSLGVFWSYRTLGRYLPAPSLVSIWIQCVGNVMERRADVVRTFGEAWSGRSRFALAAEMFRRILAHPEGVEVMRLRTDRNLDDHLGFADKRVRVAPQPMIGEIERALATKPATDAEYPFVLASGLRTRWTANTIHRDPAWRKGSGPHCALNLSPADAKRLGVAKGDRLRVETRRGAIELPAAIDDKLLEGHVWMPNGFGVAYAPSLDGEVEVQGANLNELTDGADRDPFTGCPHHRYVPCRITPVAAGAGVAA